MTYCSRSELLQRTRYITGSYITDIRGQSMTAHCHDILIIYGLLQMYGEGLIGLIPQQFILTLRLSQGMTIDTVVPQSRHILTHVIQMLAVCSPCQISTRIPKCILQHLTRLQVLYHNGIDTTTHKILSISHILIIRAHPWCSNTRIFLPFSQDIDIQQHLFLLLTFGNTRIDGIVLTRLIPSGVGVSTFLIRYTGIIGSQPASHLLIQRILKGLQRLEISIGILILCLQVIQHILSLLVWSLCILLVIAQAHPKVRVHPLTSELLHHIRHLLSHRSLRSLTTSSQQNQSSHQIISFLFHSSLFSQKK